MHALDIALLRRALNDNYVLVLTTNSHERKAVANGLKPSAKAVVQAENDGARLGVCGEQLILHLTGTSGAQADKAVGRITRRMLSDRRMPKPKAVILVGIAWGAPLRCNLHDVILSGELLAVNHIRFEGGNTRHVPISRASPWLTELADISVEIGRYSNPAKVGVLASGEQFVADDEARDALLAAFPQIIGGEMEGWDLVPDLQDIPWIQIRGVCDSASTGLSRIDQSAAAERAAELLPLVIVALEERGRLLPIKRDPATVGLLEVLNGESLHITDSGDGDVSLDDHLNYRIGPSLIWRIAQYALGTPPAAAMPRLLTALLLEMAQNAIKYGGAVVATIQFGENSVTYSDDGETFDLYTLANNPKGRGGRKALADVISCLVETNSIEISVEPDRPSSKNMYRISFPMLSAQVREARQKCPIEVNYFGDSIVDVSGRLIYNSECRTLFFDTSELLMYSRRFDVIEALQFIFDNGHDIIIKCDNESEKAFYEGSLMVPDDRRLSVIASPMALFANS